MRKHLTTPRIVQYLLALLFSTYSLLVGAQTSPPLTGPTDIRQYAIYAEASGLRLLDSINYGVEVRENSTVSGGIVGSAFMVRIARGTAINASVYSGNRLSLGFGNTINGHLVARNDAGVGWPVITVGSENQVGASSGGRIHARGHVTVDNTSTVQGPVLIEDPYTYTGPTPINGQDNVATLDMPIMPSLPTPATLPPYGRTSITTSTTISPGAYFDVALTGSATLTFSEPGTYVFASIRNTGINKFDFIIPPSSTAQYKIYVHGDVDLGSLQTNINGLSYDGNIFPGSSQIYLETHGTGDTQGGEAFILRDILGAGDANWAGTVYAAYGRIRIDGSTATNTTVHGALWSRSRVLIGMAATIYYEPLSDFTNVFIMPYYPPPPGGKVNAAMKIGAELYSLSTNPDLPIAADNDIFQVVGDKVWIEVIAKQGTVETLKATLASMGGTGFVVNEPGSLVLTLLFPIAKLQDINNLFDVDYARPLFEPLTKAGAVMTEGARTMKADLVAAGYPTIRGEGIKIGVISDSYDRSSANIQYAPLDVAAGELPGAGNAANSEPVQVVLECPMGLKSDEGRAMLQIVHDIAPKAKLAFRTGFISAGDFSNGIRKLADPTLTGGGCQVIVDDVSYLTEPYFTDGVIAKAVDEVVANGITYITSAGNFGERSYESPFSGTLVNGVMGEAHNFGSDGVYQPLSLKAGTYTLVLQWEDQFYSLGGTGNTGAAIDMDFYLADLAGNILFGFNRTSTGVDPYEVLPFVVNSDTEARLLIVKASGTAPPAGFRLKYIIFRGNAQIANYTGNRSTIVGQANSSGAISVGAILYDNPLQIPGYPVETLPPGYTHPTVASFSSRGGTVITGETADARKKPDLIAPNGVNTTVPLGVNDIDGDGRINFFGTSAAAPHVAAVAGLLIQAKQTFALEQPTPDWPAQLRTLLTSTATSISGSADHNTTSGYGLTNADAAMRTIGYPRPTLLSLHMDDPANPGTLIPIPNPAPPTPFTLVAKGANLSANTVIYFDGVAMTTARTGNDLLSATVTVNNNANTVITKLYTEPKSASGLDGGFSNEFAGLYNTLKKQVEVRVNNATRLFGEPDPVFSSIATLDGVPVTDNATRLLLKLDQVTYSTTATSTSPVYVYPIRASIAFTSSDEELLAEYQYNFVPGALAIGKLPVTITPNDVVITAGEYPDVTYTYDFGGIVLDDEASLRAATAEAHKKQVASNALAVMHGFDAASPALTDADLQNRSFMASYQAVRNGRKFLWSSGDLVPLTTDLPPGQLSLQRFLVDVSAQSLNHYKTTPYQLTLTPAYTGGPNRGIANGRDIAQRLVTTMLTGGQLLTISNGDLLNVSNGQLLTISNNGSYLLVDGQLYAIENVQVSASGDITVRLADGSTVPLGNGQLLTISNGQLLTISNGQLLTISNGDDLTITSGQLLTISNGDLFTVVNGEIRMVDYVEVTASGEVKVYSNGQLLTISNTDLIMAFFNGQLLTISNGQLLTISNGQLLTISNTGDLLNLTSGQLLTISNDLSVGSGNSNTGAMVVVDEADVTVQEGYLGGLVPVNLITGMEAGTQKLLAATFINDNYDISYGLGTVTVHPRPAVTLTATNPAPLGGIVTIDAGFNSDALELQWHYDIPTDSVTVTVPAGSTIPTSIAVTNLTPAVYPVYLTYKNTADREFRTPTVYAVFFDPAAGFVTGGGWINSPVVPTVPYMQVDGQAHFGFVSKYEKGKTVPTGNTHFQFQAGGLSFRSTAYKWLTVSGARTQFKGTGTINDAGSYGFLLTAVDGNLLSTVQPDRFRIKIWDVASDALMYDNMIGESDNADLVNSEYTLLGGGSVTIHVPRKTTTSKPVTTTAQLPTEEQAYTGALKVAVQPNPSTGHFRLVMQSGSAEPLQLRVTDLVGRVVEQRTGLPANGTLRLGERYSSGIYVVEVRQGSEKRLLRLVKALQGRN